MSLFLSGVATEQAIFKGRGSYREFVLDAFMYANLSAVDTTTDVAEGSGQEAVEFKALS